MLHTPDVMRMAFDLARHSGARQSVIAANIANADTPVFRAQDVESFAEIHGRAAPSVAMKTTDARHFTAAPSASAPRLIEVEAEAAPNGNTVSLEQEMVRATRAKSDHDLAITIYRGSLDILKTTLGRGR